MDVWGGGEGRVGLSSFGGEGRGSETEREEMRGVLGTLRCGRDGEIEEAYERRGWRGIEVHAWV